MKFKKDGKVFEDIQDAVGNFCDYAMQGSCDDCPLYRNQYSHKDSKEKLDGCSFTAMSRSPINIARLMGYEVVEDGKECETVKCYRDGGCGPYEMNSCSECPASKPEYAEKKEAVMEKRKPHKDWTLGEVQRYCAARNGNCSDDCAFSRKGVGFVCKVALKPRDWGLSTPPRFTEEEVADARAIVKLLPYPELTLCRENGGSLWLESTAMSYLHLSGNAFPSILPGTSVSLKEIASETE